MAGDLHKAAKKGNIQDIVGLLQKGVDWSEIDKEGKLFYQYFISSKDIHNYVLYNELLEFIITLRYKASYYIPVKKEKEERDKWEKEGRDKWEKEKKGKWWKWTGQELREALLPDKNENFLIITSSDTAFVNYLSYRLAETKLAKGEGKALVVGLRDNLLKFMKEMDIKKSIVDTDAVELALKSEISRLRKRYNNAVALIESLLQNRLHAKKKSVFFAKAEVLKVVGSLPLQH